MDEADGPPPELRDADLTDAQPTDAEPTDADREITDLAEAVKDDLDAALNGLTWIQNRPQLSTARTGPRASDPVDRHYTFGVARHLDEDEWDRAIAIVAAHARRVGYTGAELAVDRLEDHEARFYAEDGRILTFGTATSTIFRVTVRPGAGLPAHMGGSGAAPGSGAVGSASAGSTSAEPLIGPAGADLPDAAPDIVDEVPRW
ncbi:LppA family lipoprotein [Georgenia sp. Z1344]|uniref:LppA family lipoprotein n=1 Tax=Georgenia sp. Z1344 TaxID=3416706 RepID=UPI003CE91F5E